MIDVLLSIHKENTSIFALLDFSGASKTVEALGAFLFSFGGIPGDQVLLLRPKQGVYNEFLHLQRFYLKSPTKLIYLSHIVFFPR